MSTKRKLTGNTRALLIVGIALLFFVMISSPEAGAALRIALENIAEGDFKSAKRMIEFAIGNQESFLKLHLLFIVLVLIKSGFDLHLLKRLPDDER